MKYTLWQAFQNNEEACYYWGDIFSKDMNVIAEEMKKLGQLQDFQQEVRDNIIQWKTDKGKVYFFIIKDPENIDTIINMYQTVKQDNPVTAFAVVYQKNDHDDRGDKLFDFFKLSKESYLWHLNRVYPQKSSK